jgi:hypothetical protein
MCTNSSKIPQTWNLTKSILWEPLVSSVSRRIGSPDQLPWLWYTRMSLGLTSASKSFPSSYASVYIWNISSKFSFMRHSKCEVRQDEWPWHKHFRRHAIFYVYLNTSEKKFEYVQILLTFCSTLTKDIRATTGRARGGRRREKTAKSMKMEENQSTLKRMNCKLSSLQILECIRQTVWRRKKEGPFVRRNSVPTQ